MIEYILIFFFIIFVLFNENILKFYHIKAIYNNYGLIKIIIKNLLYALPLLTLFFNYNSIIDKMKQSRSLVPNSNIKNQLLNNQLLNNQLKNNYSYTKDNRNVSQTLKKYVAANQQWKCNYCNNLLDASYEVDHKIPLYKNGSNDISNLQALCRNCHGKKTIYDKLNN